jgi:hypothetical protein
VAWQWPDSLLLRILDLAELSTDIVQGEAVSAGSMPPLQDA